MPSAQNTQSVTAETKSVRLLAKAADAASMAPVVERRALSRAANEVLIEVKAAAVNPSDIKAATGLMPYAVCPRTSGRDYAGVVIDGPAGTIGREVFGSSGDLGIRRDGTHATHLAVEAEAAHVATALTEELEPLAGRVVAPYALLEFDAPDLCQEIARLREESPVQFGRSREPEAAQ